jgi:DNA-binding NtrC family response regulator
VETEGPAAKAPIRILIVDDEPPAKNDELYLRRLGYAVTTLDRTEQALAQVPHGIEEYAAAVLDATMEGVPMETLACDILRAHPGLRVLAASGYPVDMRTLEATAPRRVAFSTSLSCPRCWRGRCGG